MTAHWISSPVHAATCRPRRSWKASIVAMLVVLATMVVAERAVAQAHVERRVALNAGAMIKGFVPAGSVRIIGWDRDSLVITGSIASADRLFFGGGGAGVKFVVESRSGGAESPATHLVIHLPRKSQMSMKGVSATIEATDASGSFYSVSGDVTIAGDVGEVEAEAMDGSVTVTAHARWVRARTASGTLRLTGEIVDAAASSITGPVFVSSSGLASGQFGSVAGDIVFAAPLREGGVFAFDNHSGAIELRLGPSAAGSFSMTTIAGRIENEMVATRPAGGQSGRGQSVAFQLGVGGSHVTVRTFKGTIRLRNQ